MLMNVEIVKWLQHLMNLNGIQNWLNRAGFPVDVMAVVENQFKSSYPDQNNKGVFTYIKNNLVYFINGNPDEVTRSINNYLLLDPKVIDFFGYPITIYSDPSHLRTYALYLAGIFMLYMMMSRKRK